MDAKRCWKLISSVKKALRPAQTLLTTQQVGTVAQRCRCCLAVSSGSAYSATACGDVACTSVEGKEPSCPWVLLNWGLVMIPTNLPSIHTVHSTKSTFHPYTEDCLPFHCFKWEFKLDISIVRSNSYLCAVSIMFPGHASFQHCMPQVLVVMILKLPPQPSIC